MKDPITRISVSIVGSAPAALMAYSHLGQLILDLLTDMITDGRTQAPLMMGSVRIGTVYVASMHDPGPLDPPSDPDDYMRHRQ